MIYSSVKDPAATTKGSTTERHRVGVSQLSLPSLWRRRSSIYIAILLCITFLISALSLSTPSRAALCGNRVTFDTYFNMDGTSKSCTVGDFTFSNFSLEGTRANGNDIAKNDIFVTTAFANLMATITFGFSGQNVPVLNAGQNQSASAEFTYDVSTATNEKFTTGAADMSDTVAHTGNDTFVKAIKTINPENVVINVVDNAARTPPKSNDGPKPVGGRMISIDDTATAAGGIAADGSADIMSINDTFTKKVITVDSLVADITSLLADPANVSKQRNVRDDLNTSPVGTGRTGVTVVDESTFTEGGQETGDIATNFGNVNSTGGALVLCQRGGIEESGASGRCKDGLDPATSLPTFISDVVAFPKRASMLKFFSDPFDGKNGNLNFTNLNNADIKQMLTNLFGTDFGYVAEGFLFDVRDFGAPDGRVFRDNPLDLGAGNDFAVYVFQAGKGSRAFVVASDVDVDEPGSFSLLLTGIVLAVGLLGTRCLISKPRVEIPTILNGMPSAVSASGASVWATAAEVGAHSMLAERSIACRPASSQ